MIKLRYCLTLWGIVLLLNACASNKDFMVKLYDEKDKREITDPSDYEIVVFRQESTPNALAGTISDPRVWFGAGISAPSRHLKLLKADDKGVFHIPVVLSLSDFLVVLNKEKSLIACYNVQWNEYLPMSDGREKENFSGRNFFDITCKDEKMGDEERREYYRKIFSERNIDSIRMERKKYNVSNYYQSVTQDNNTKEQFVAPLYIGGSHPGYLLPNKGEIDRAGDLKNFYNLKG